MFKGMAFLFHYLFSASLMQPPQISEDPHILLEEVQCLDLCDMFANK